ncbi:MAG: hypothetical protein R2761_16315 [Acidimicrobiales bacterium]
MSTVLRYYRGAERPALQLWIQDDDGTLVDFSSGYTFSFKIGDTTALLTKTSGIVGAAGAGVEPTGTPNITVNWSTGELDITPGAYSWELTATTGGLDRIYRGVFHVLATL